jgi:hypothetical protein
MAAADEGVKAGSEVCRHEEWSPQFVLPHVYTFVRAGHLERLGVSANHYMSQCYRCGPAGQRRQPAERAAEQRAVRFDDAIHQRRPTASD